jgi:hypothetical protein
MEIKKTEQPATLIKPSRYVAAGSPTACFLPSCHKPFEQGCFRGKDGHFYCSPDCTEAGSKLDLSQVEELRPNTSSHLPSPQQKLSVGKR